MNTCQPLDPRVTMALTWAKDYWYLLVMGAMALVIIALWRHGR